MGLRKNRRDQMREALFRLSCSFSPGISRAVFNISSVRRFLGLGTSDKVVTVSTLNGCVYLCPCYEDFLIYSIYYSLTNIDMWEFKKI